MLGGCLGGVLEAFLRGCGRCLGGNHKGNIKEKTRINKLTELYSSFPMEGGKNTIVSAHNGVIDCNMFINNKCPKGLKLEEGGFYVIRNTKDGLLFEHEFHNFQVFIKQFFER